MFCCSNKLKDEEEKKKILNLISKEILIEEEIVKVATRLLTLEGEEKIRKEV